jgi:hypothetical protein
VITLNSLGNIAARLGHQGQHAEAERIGKQVMQTMRRVFGPDQGDTLQAMGTLAEIYLEQEKYAEAQPLLVSGANCDNSTINPVLNVNDFSCFLNQYAAGCP